MNFCSLSFSHAGDRTADIWRTQLWTKSFSRSSVESVSLEAFNC